ncbi:MAG: amidohydrolase family protein [Crocinitomicaceae bacterium]|nr:amidohydrolase family protein [Crocinitomicaceae bacterium]
MKLFLVIGLSLLFSFAFGQIKPNNGVQESQPQYYALKNATIIVSPDKTILRGTILIKGDKILKVGPAVSIPNGAVVIDCGGKTILPAFVELNSSIGLPTLKRTEWTGVPQLESRKKGPYYWNECIHPEMNANELYTNDEDANEALVKMGFGYALTRQRDGVAQGVGAFVALGRDELSVLKQQQATSFFSFHKGVSRQTYPSSQMGSIALLRQAFYDAAWYQDNGEETNISLDALNAQIEGPMIFTTSDKLEILRAQKVADEFSLSFTYIGSGNEYQLAEELADIKSTVILPLNFPEAYDVKSPYIARQIPLSELKHWELAPMNAAILNNSGVSICLSSTDIEKEKDFWKNLRSAIQGGLPESVALDALTMQPAKLIGQESLIGTIEPGKLASFMVYDVNPLEQEAELLQSWILGKQQVFKVPPLHDIRGKYNIQLDGEKFPIEITGSTDDLEGEVTYTQRTPKGELIEKKTEAFVELNGHDVTIQFVVHGENYEGSISLQGKVSSKFGVFEGDAMLPDGRWVKWSGIKKSGGERDPKKEPVAEMDTTKNVWFPNMAYGFETLPEAETIIIKNATLWTNEADGIIETGTVVIQDGKIVYAGAGSKSIAGARVIDAEGKHVTSGIIDEHSHIAISNGVNEGGQAISAEVSIGDVVDPDDIDIYRQLAGGVTAAQLLHGSANPIGGQSALIKLKWGHTADEMLIDNAPKFIKFALGENVKQSNWGDYSTIRFPQTRMGVEQVFYDGFFRAREYKKAWDAFALDPSSTQPRKDLELEVLNEILNNECFISCHSYVQSEINMLMHVADSMGFRVNTFTHILEGYKLADKMVEHGAGGSTFSDWWAYKYEVNDAIPYNAALMHSQGVVVAINSDDAEMGRRLNQEAAKGVKYGGMSEEDAWKMVTLNPAKLLHLDDRMGSLKEGKDADIVIWSDNPLSILARVEYTIVDGVILYDLEEDERLRVRNQEERARIISKMLDDNENGGKKKPFFRIRRGHFHCNTLGEDASLEENHH